MNETITSVTETTTTHKAKPTLLPANLGALADLAGKPGHGRYGLEAVHLRTHGDGTYLAETTDGKWLARVTGPTEDADSYPSLPAIESAPNGECESLVPAGEWKKAFKSLPKRACKSILANVATVIGKDVTTLATTNLDTQTVLQPRNVDGRFPDTVSCIPGGAPLALIRIDSERLAKLAKMSAEFVGDDDNTVTLEIYSPNRPLVIAAENKGQKLTALLMPMGLPTALLSELEQKQAEDRTLRDGAADLLSVCLRITDDPILEQMDADLRTRLYLAINKATLPERKETP